jgi:hypothetical protein
VPEEGFQSGELIADDRRHRRCFAFPRLLSLFAAIRIWVLADRAGRGGGSREEAQKAQEEHDRDAIADEQNLLRKEYSRDGLHLNQAGYRVWARLIEDVLPPLKAESRPGT